MPRQLPTEVRTPRLLLREWTESDAEALGELVTANLEHLRPWMAWIADESTSVDQRRAQIAAWRAKRSAGEDVTIGVFLRDGTPVGSTGFHDRGAPNTLEIGYWLAAEHTGRGYATELSEWLTTAGLAAEGIGVIEISHDPANAASAAVPRRLGYEEIAPGRWRMTAERWPMAKRQTINVCTTHAPR